MKTTPHIPITVRMSPGAHGRVETIVDWARKRTGRFVSFNAVLDAVILVGTNRREGAALSQYFPKERKARPASAAAGTPRLTASGK